MSSEAPAAPTAAVVGAYSVRPSYAPSVIDQILRAVGRENLRVADIGAGTGNLTLELLVRGCTVDAVEPHQGMRRAGVVRSSSYSGVTWHEGCGEASGLPSRFYDLATFGSSFDHTRSADSLGETARILRVDGWLACIWNRRTLDDPLQARIEAIVRSYLPDYAPPRRLEDQSAAISASGLFRRVSKIEGFTSHQTTLYDWMNSWLAHEPLRRQAGNSFSHILHEVERLTREVLIGNHLSVPYRTTGWLAQRAQR